MINRKIFCKSGPWCTLQAVLYYYQSGGRLKRPLEVPEDVFLDELQFYEISEKTILEYKVKEGFLVDKVRPTSVSQLLGRIAVQSK